MDFGDDDVKLTELSCGDVQYTVPEDWFNLNDIFKEGCFGDVTETEATDTGGGKSLFLLEMTETAADLDVPAVAFFSRPAKEMKRLSSTDMLDNCSFAIRDSYG